ncbi:MAG: hypothetical protein OEL89_02840 [Candidatus Peregrinibacteria bacterium]|nr:hypothetical protein [Candidatus Peregrinibacteria bacterium]
MKKMFLIGFALLTGAFALNSTSAYFGVPRTYTGGTYSNYSNYSYAPTVAYFSAVPNYVAPRYSARSYSTPTSYLLQPRTSQTHVNYLNNYPINSGYRINNLNNRTSSADDYYYLPFFESKRVYTNKSVLNVEPYHTKSKDFHGYIASDRTNDYYANETIKNIQVGEKIRFFVQSSSLNRSMGVSWKWHYNSKGLQCTEQRNGQELECTVAQNSPSDVWVEFFVPEMGGSIYGDKVHSNYLTVIPNSGTRYSSSKRKVYYDGYSSNYYDPRYYRN